MDKPLENYPRILAGQRPQTLGELFSKPSRWIKGTDAKNAQGAGCEIRNPGAVQWCIGGGTRLIYGEHPEKIQEIHAKFREYMKDQLGLNEPDDSDDEIDPDAIPDMATWNDNESRTFKELRAMLKATGI